MSHLIVIGLLTVGADPLNEAAKKELQTLQGEWVVVRIETKDAVHDVGEEDRISLTFKDATWAFGTVQKGEVVALDPSTNPKVIDLTSVRGTRVTHNEGIYKRDGDTLIVSIYQGKDKKRPTSFDRPTEDQTVLWTLKRAKPAEKP